MVTRAHAIFVMLVAFLLGSWMTFAIQPSAMLLVSCSLTVVGGALLAERTRL